jgi:hypothetical protein
LSISQTAITGPIPPSLGNLSQLEILDLGYSPISGSVPAELGYLYNLEKLVISGTQLSGTLPSEFGHMVKLKELWIGNGLLSGPLPQTMTAMPYLELLEYEAPLCEPGNAQFQVWLSHIAAYHNLYGSRITCGASPVSKSFAAGGGTLSSPEDMTTHSFDPGTFYATVTVTHTPQSSDSAPPNPGTENLLPRSAVLAAQSAGLINIGHVFLLSATAEGGGAVQPGKAFTTVIQYSDYQVQHVSENRLALYWWDGSSWHRETSSVVNSATNTLTAHPTRFSLWAVFGRMDYFLYLPLIQR